jgi:hypothetical protein
MAFVTQGPQNAASLETPSVSGSSCDIRTVGQFRCSSGSSKEISKNAGQQRNFAEPKSLILRAGAQKFPTRWSSGIKSGNSGIFPLLRGIAGENPLTLTNTRISRRSGLGQRDDQMSDESNSLSRAAINALPRGFFKTDLMPNSTARLSIRGSLIAVIIITGT